MTRLARLLAVLVVALPLLIVATPPAQAVSCLAASYQPDFTTSNHFYVNGTGTLNCSGTDVTQMGIKVVLQRYFAIDGHWADMTTQTSSAWHKRYSSGVIGATTVSLACLTSQQISYRTRVRWYVDSYNGNSGTNSLYSGYKTLECGR